MEWEEEAAATLTGAAAAEWRDGEQVSKKEVATKQEMAGEAQSKKQQEWIVNKELLDNGKGKNHHAMSRRGRQREKRRLRRQQEKATRARKRASEIASSPAEGGNNGTSEQSSPKRGIKAQQCEKRRSCLTPRTQDKFNCEKLCVKFADAVRLCVYDSDSDDSAQEKWQGQCVAEDVVVKLDEKCVHPDPDDMSQSDVESCSELTTAELNCCAGGTNECPDGYGRTVTNSNEAALAKSSLSCDPTQKQLSPMYPGLNHPTVASGARVDGSNKRQYRRENKAKRIAQQISQAEGSYWTKHEGKFVMPQPEENDLEMPMDYRGEMCPSGLALHHPAAATLLQYATQGCPSNTGRPWTREQMQEAIDRGPHSSALEPDAIAQMKAEIQEKLSKNQVRLVEWDSIKDNPPKQLKISPLAMIPHKSRKYRAILDLSFKLRLKNGEMLPSVNENTTLEAPVGAIDQLGHSLQQVIHAFAEAGPEEKVFMAKFDIKDGFWRLVCEEGEEWNFTYMLPQEEGAKPVLVVPNSLQMGWVESPGCFGTASETARDVAAQYAERPVGSLPRHKFIKHAMSGEAIQQLPKSVETNDLRYFIDVYVDDFFPMAIATSQEQLQHVATAVLMGVHDVFPTSDVPEDDPISHKKLEKLEGQFALNKEILGFDFDGDSKTMILCEPKRDFLLMTLHKWVRASESRRLGVPFQEFESVISKIRHAFIALPAGRGLMTPFNKILQKRPPVVYFHRNKALKHAVMDCRTILRESTKYPTPCKELVISTRQSA